ATPISPPRTPPAVGPTFHPSPFILTLSSHSRMAPKWLRVATMRRPGSFAPRFPISLIPADIPGSFCEFRFLRLIRNAVGEEGLYGPPVPAQPRERRRNQHGSTVKVLPYTRAV